MDHKPTPEIIALDYRATPWPMQERKLLQDDNLSTRDTLDDFAL